VLDAFSASDKLAELKEDYAFLLALEFLPLPPSIPLLANVGNAYICHKERSRPRVFVGGGSNYRCNS